MLLVLHVFLEFVRSVFLEFVRQGGSALSEPLEVFKYGFHITK